MPRNVTVTFADGAQHTYEGVPDGATPDEVQTRAEKQFAKTVKGIDGGASQAAAQSAGMAPEAGAGRGLVNPSMDAPDGIPRMLPRQRASPSQRNQTINPVDIPAGLVRGAASIGATLTNMPGAGYFDRREQNLAQVDEALKSMGADPTSATYGASKLAGEVAGTAGVPGALGRVAGAAGAATPVVNALRTGGFATGATPQGAAEIVTNAATRAGAGAAAGGGMVGLVDPEHAGMGAMVGGTLPGAVQAAGWAGAKAGQALNAAGASVSDSAARRVAMSKIAEAAPKGLQPIAAPGDIPLTLAASTQDPAIARLEQASRLKSPEHWFGFDQKQGEATFDKLMSATSDATDMTRRSIARSDNWKQNWADVQNAVNPKYFNARVPKFSADIDTALISPESSNPQVRGMLEAIKSEIDRLGPNFSPAHLQQIRANLSGKYNPISSNAFQSVPRDSSAVRSVLSEVDDILNKSSDNAWDKVLKGYTADSGSLHESKAAAKVRASFIDPETGRVRGTSLDAAGDTPRVTEAGLGRAMDAARMPATNKLALSGTAESGLSDALEALRAQGIVQKVKRSASAGGGSDTASNLTAMAPSGATKTVLSQLVSMARDAGSKRTNEQLAMLLQDSAGTAKLLQELPSEKATIFKRLLSKTSGSSASQP